MRKITSFHLFAHTLILLANFINSEQIDKFDCDNIIQNGHGFNLSDYNKDFNWIISSGRDPERSSRRSYTFNLCKPIIPKGSCGKNSWFCQIVEELLNGTSKTNRSHSFINSPASTFVVETSDYKLNSLTFKGEEGGDIKYIFSCSLNEKNIDFEDFSDNGWKDGTLKQFVIRMLPSHSSCGLQLNSSMGAGKIFLILVLIIVFVYFAGGYLYNSQVLYRSGIDAIPNVDFWRSLPERVSNSLNKKF